MSLATLIADPTSDQAKDEVIRLAAGLLDGHDWDAFDEMLPAGAVGLLAVILLRARLDGGDFADARRILEGPGAAGFIDPRSAAQDEIAAVVSFARRYVAWPDTLS
jgi:hypothetical protein